MPVTVRQSSVASHGMGSIVRLLHVRSQGCAVQTIDQVAAMHSVGRLPSSLSASTLAIVRMGIDLQ